MKKVLLLLPALWLLAGAFRADAPAGYKPGDKAADFNLKDVSGEMVSLAGLKDAKGCILIFTCNHCPFSVAYEDRIIALHREYADKGFPVVAINSNDVATVPEDSYEKMIERSREKKFSFRYLHDETQKVARTYGATRTPHVYVLQKTGSDFFVRYIGAIDNNTEQAEAASAHYVKDAVEALISGKEVSTPLTKAIGCTIKWKK
jgi:peroxiredoxin